MNYGPELLKALLPELQQYQNRQLQRIDAGSDWCAMTFKGMAAFFFSWNAEISGICTFSQGRIKALSRSQNSKTPFILGLQRHLMGASLQEVSQYQEDRVLRFRFQKFLGGGISRDFTLTLELMGRLSNVILTNEDNLILEAAKHLYPDRNRYRSIIPGLAYAPPPPIEGLSLSAGMDDENLERALERPQGLGKKVALLLQSLWLQGEKKLVRTALFSSPPVFQKIGSCLTALGALLPGAETVEQSGLEACRAFIAEAIESRTRNRISAQILKELERQKGRRIKHIDDLLLQIHRSENCDAMRIAGQAILNNLESLKGKSGTVKLPYWDEEGENFTEVVLDPCLDASGNAKKYFKLYQKYRADVGAVKEKIRQLEGELADIAALQKNIARVKSPDSLAELCSQAAEQYSSKVQTKQRSGKNKKAVLPPHLRFDAGDNSSILVGMNERGNRYVTFTAADPDDLWFHVHEHPGAHVILKTPPKNKDLLIPLIRAAASLALFYSSAGEEAAVIDYTEKKQVRHISGGGPANVTYKRPQTILVNREEWKEVLSEPR